MAEWQGHMVKVGSLSLSLALTHTLCLSLSFTHTLSLFQTHTHAHTLSLALSDTHTLSHAQTRSAGAHGEGGVSRADRLAAAQVCPLTPEPDQVARRLDLAPTI